MAWEISFSPRAVKSFKKLDTGEQRRVSKFLREVGALEDPRLRGKALTANKSGLWLWRVGDYRIIADIVDARVVVVVVDVGHRSKVYD
ncbi:type II toxin-antitoxin system RelE family toxin [Corynebacterium diphtheriae]|uniref:type II toxin-antitoxin system RelE family toxin n=1 Tax=Corynebacterium diphtheriae TaxID=1717 RepID=UPI00041BE8DF|nr:type II toxin-antitoxin system RelE/ParE family toxin [Corynebacterium diphtheriae]KLN43490.1 toxin RelE [Corynebacterium diphtheriae bv. gravis str. ISS 4746]KLN45349.1 toxin RelE [Corynebacterium diphtheriae bv. gravis str. ISS 4749]MBG9369342.1 type II toxin-antitoxin system RelE/ParE family toxin [Corynebacterium diphtheriae bv. gravis]MBG9380573.1 type II toxin-antitoxin system RelE/ParE family toxin [Corynebacterium diphtheriae bv. gravis]OWN50474.1 addiction module toxin RelE [Coryne